MDDRLLTALIVVVGVPAVLFGYIALTERLIQLAPERVQGRIRPWLWLAPGLLFLVVFLVYPTIYTAYLSLLDRASQEFVGLANYEYFFTNSDTLISLRNNASWTGSGTSRWPSRSSSCRWPSASSGRA
jgi:alpha-glucoside transport system permease protein